MNPLSNGTVLQNRYKIISTIGQGGMGTVYKIEQINLKPYRVLALKEMIDNFQDQTEKNKAKEQFELEANVLYNLDHPNLPKVYDYFVENNKYYLVMDFIDGVTLDKYLKNNHNISEQKIIDLTIKLLEILNYLHSQNVIFRDLKPANIMIERATGKFKLIDFGIIKIFSSQNNKTKTIVKFVGSPGFAPIEQYGQGHTDERSDIYSLGSTIYYCLTGNTPPEAVNRLINNQPLQKIPCSTDFRKIILKSLEIMANNRYQSADKMLGKIMNIEKKFRSKAKPISNIAQLITNSINQAKSVFNTSHKIVYKPSWQYKFNSWQDYLEYTFQCQTETLLNKGYPKAANLSEQDFLNRYIYPLKQKLHQIKESDVDDDCYHPFIIVIPKEIVALDKQIEMVRVGSRKIVYKSKGEKIIDIYSISSFPYFVINLNREIYPIESGIKVFEIFSLYTKKLGLTSGEGISLITYYSDSYLSTNGKTCITLFGSRLSNDPNETPLIYLEMDGTASVFTSRNIYGSGVGWGIMSCNKRI